MKKLNFTYILTAVLLIGCRHNFIYEKESVVKKVEIADDRNYKYKVFIDGFPTTQILFTNIPYQVGDTVKYCR